MDNGREVVVLSGVRTAIGDYGGSLKDVAPTELAARVVTRGGRRAKIAPDDVGHVVLGNVIHTEPKDMYISRVASINARTAQGDARADAEPPVRQRSAGHRLGGADRSSWAMPTWQSAAAPNR